MLLLLAELLPRQAEIHHTNAVISSCNSITALPSAYYVIMLLLYSLFLFHLLSSPCNFFSASYTTALSTCCSAAVTIDSLQPPYSYSTTAVDTTSMMTNNIQFHMRVWSFTGLYTFYRTCLSSITSSTCIKYIWCDKLP